MKGQTNLTGFPQPIKRLNSPIKYPGGKSRAVNIICPLIPDDVKVLASPFFGGGWIELTMSNMGVKVYGYDIFDPLVCLWQEILEDVGRLADECRKYYPMTRKRYYQMKHAYDQLESRLDKAVYYYISTKMSFSGIFFGGISGRPDFTLPGLDTLEKFKAPNVASVENLDFKKSIPKHKDDFLYLDPPYMITSYLYGRGGDTHKDFDHQGLREILGTRYRWLLSYNDCKAIRDLYKGYQMVSPSWNYGRTGGGVKKSKELLIFSPDYREQEL